VSNTLPQCNQNVFIFPASSSIHPLLFSLPSSPLPFPPTIFSFPPSPSQNPSKESGNAARSPEWFTKAILACLKPSKYIWWQEFRLSHAANSTLSATRFKAETWCKAAALLHGLPRHRVPHRRGHTHGYVRTTINIRIMVMQCNKCNCHNYRRPIIVSPSSRMEEGDTPHLKELTNRRVSSLTFQCLQAAPSRRGGTDVVQQSEHLHPWTRGSAFRCPGSRLQRGVACASEHVSRCCQTHNTSTVGCFLLEHRYWTKTTIRRASKMSSLWTYDRTVHNRYNIFSVGHINT